MGLASPEVDHEIVDDDSGEALAWADLAWPDGLQTGLSEPTAFLVEPDEELERRLGQLGWRFYTDETGLIQHFEAILGTDISSDGITGEPNDIRAEAATG